MSTWARVKDDPKKYAARDDWFTGGWPGGEVGLKEGFAREDGAGASKSEMLPAGTCDAGERRRRRESRRLGRGLPVRDPRSPSSDDAPGVPSRDDRFGATAAAVRAAKYALVKRLAALDRGVAADDADRRARTRWWRSSSVWRAKARAGGKNVRAGG